MTNHQAQVDAAREECKRLILDLSTSDWKERERGKMRDAIDRLAALVSESPAPGVLTAERIDEIAEQEFDNASTESIRNFARAIEAEVRASPAPPTYQVETGGGVYSTICGTSIQAPAPAASEPVACNQVAPGNGYCEQCAAGHYERCRYIPQPPAAGSDEQDALRYRWLRGRYLRVMAVDDTGGVVFDLECEDIEVNSESDGQRIDAAIDAAIQGGLK